MQTGFGSNMNYRVSLNMNRSKRGKENERSCPWRTARCPKSQKEYYYHIVTKETTWKKPDELKTAKEILHDEIKESEKREFFAAMEKNVRRNVELGVLPEVLPKSNTKVKFAKAYESSIELDSSMVHLSLEEFSMLPKPTLQKRNTCGTLYVEGTMSTPDKDKTIECVCSVIHSYIIKSSSRMEKEKQFSIFNDDLPLAKVPTLEDVTEFYKGIFYKAQMEPDTIIMSLIYLDRLRLRSKNKLCPNRYNWRSLLFSTMILSSKIWDDLSMWNVDFSQVNSDYSLARINQLEIALITCLNYCVKVPASEYALYYFKLREMNGLKICNLIPLNMESIRKLEENHEALRKTTKPLCLRRRTKSESQETIFSPKSPRVALEQVVQM